MRVNVFIRKENEDKWKAISNKSDWINALLSNSTDTSLYGKTIKEPIERVVVLSETLPQAEDDFQRFLRDYSVPGERKPPHPEFGYPCCYKDTPCKHWVWDTQSATYKNTLTGKTREATI